MQQQIPQHIGNSKAKISQRPR